MTHIADKLYNELQQAWVWLSGNKVSYVKALLVLVIALICAKLIEWFVSIILVRFFNNIKIHIPNTLVKYIRDLVFISIVLIGLVLCLNHLPLAKVGYAIILSCIKTIAILVYARFIIRTGALTLNAISQNKATIHFIQPETQPLLRYVLSLVTIGFSLYFFFLAWHIDPMAWVASAGVIGLALGLAAKDSLANLFAGAFIIADTPYKIGDMISLSSGERGNISHIGLRSTRLLTRDGIEITMPNAKIAASKIINESGGPHIRRRIKINVGVAYGSDINQVEKILIQIAEQHPCILKDPEPSVRFTDFGDSSVDFSLRVWVDDPISRGRTSHELRKLIYQAFSKENIEIPFPKRDVYLYQSNIE